MKPSRYHLLLVLALFLAAPALANPGKSPAERFEEVRSLRMNGELETALAKLDSLRSDFPQDLHSSRILPSLSDQNPNSLLDENPAGVCSRSWRP